MGFRAKDPRGKEPFPPHHIKSACGCCQPVPTVDLGHLAEESLSAFKSFFLSWGISNLQKQGGESGLHLDVCEGTWTFLHGPPLRNCGQLLSYSCVGRKTNEIQTGLITYS